MSTEDKKKSFFNDPDKIREKIVEIATGINGSRVPFCFGIGEIDDCDILTLILMDTITARQNFEDERAYYHKWLEEHTTIETTPEGVKVARGERICVVFGDFRDPKALRAAGLGAAATAAGDDDSKEKEKKEGEVEQQEQQKILATKLQNIKVYKIPPSPHPTLQAEPLAIVAQETTGQQHTKNEQFLYSWIKEMKMSHWSDEREERVLTASSVDGILRNCGFNNDDYHVSRMRVPCVVYLNLLTPINPYLGSAGKTHINLTPYAKLIAKTVSDLAFEMPSARGKDLKLVGESSKDPNQIAIQYLRDYLIERERAVRADPMLAFRDRRTQRGVYYHLRKKMEKAGFQPPKDWVATGKYIAESIEDVCEELSKTVWHRTVTREMLGIVAGARGQMIYAGEYYPIKYDNLKDLAQKGVAIIIIEKEGIPDLLAPFAKKYRVAIVGTQGKFIKYQRNLIEEVKKIEYGIVACLVDDDAAGNAMVRSTWTPTLKIAVSKDTVVWLRQNGYRAADGTELTVEKVWEEYTPPAGVLTAEDDPYLQHHRIEIDSIREEVGTEALWEYIVYRLELKEFSPDGFDLDKVVAKPEAIYLYPEAANNFATNFDDLIEALVRDKKEDIIENELVGAKKLEDVPKKEIDIKNRLFGIVDSDARLKPILEDIKNTDEKVKLLLKEIQDGKKNKRLTK